MKKKNTKNLNASAKVVDGILVLSLPGAVSPVVWRWTLDDKKASALEVRKQDDGTHKLILKTPRGDAQDVAPFETKEMAMQALMVVSEAMENAQGQIRSSEAYTHANETPALLAAPQPRHEETDSKEGLKVAIGLIGMAAIVAFFLWLGAGMGITQETASPASAQQTSDQDNSPSNGLETGVPLSADDVLKGL